jgi:endonuclease YncB( thermonuclease family)
LGLTCVVIGVADGDTLTARCDAKNLRIRVAEIDAPEKAQAFGNRSRQHLAALCFKKPATVRPLSIDRYGRTVARVEFDGTDASAEQVRAGMAWVFDRYMTDRSLYALRDAARADRLGLWIDPAPLAPWEWRRQRRTTETGESWR